MTYRNSLSFAMLALGVVTASHAQQGGIVIREIRSGDSAPARCIDPSKDKVSLTLRRLITTKREGWFTTANNVAVKINANVTASAQPDKPLSFPLMTTAQFGDVASGQVSVPIEYSVISGLALTQNDTAYLTVGVDVTLINLKDPSRLGVALQTLNSIVSSKKLPIPASPFTAGASYLLQFANDALDADLKKQNDTKNASVSGSLALKFDPEGICDPGTDFERAGTKAIVYSRGATGDPGYIDIGHTESYCFAAELTPVFILKSARKSDPPCTDPSYAPKMKNVANDYIAFFLNKFPNKTAGGLSSSSTRDYKESLARCQANGVKDQRVCTEGID